MLEKSTSIRERSDYIRKQRQMPTTNPLAYLKSHLRDPCATRRRPAIVMQLMEERLRYDRSPSRCRSRPM